MIFDGEMEVGFVQDRWRALSERRLDSSVIVFQITGRLGLAWRGAVVVVVGHTIPKLKAAAFMAHPVRFGCCGARSQLSFYHIITFKLARTAELWFRIGFAALRGGSFGYVE